MACGGGGRLAEGGDDGVVDAAGADGGVAEVDDGVPDLVESGEGGADGDGLAGAYFAGDHAEGAFGAHQLMRATASAWEPCRCSMPGARSRPNGMRVNP